jgi:hypothetical protein
MRVKQVTLNDREGNPHAYLITPIRASQSVDIALSILSCIAKPGSRLIRIGIEAEEINESSSPEEIQALLGKIDWSEMAQDAESVLRSLAEQPALVRRLFNGTFRDNADLSNDGHYDLAFSGNWGEWYVALKEIVAANGLLPFLDSLAS